MNKVFNIFISIPRIVEDKTDSNIDYINVVWIVKIPEIDITKLIFVKYRLILLALLKSGS